MTSHTNRRRGWTVWGFFKSVKLTLVLLMLLAAASVLGTLIPQDEGVLDAVGKTSPALEGLLNTFGVFDLYHSMWFRVIIALLAVNLLVCSLDRLPATLKRFRAVPRPDRRKIFEDLRPDRRFIVRGSPKDTAGAVAETLRRQFRHVEEKQTAGAVFLYGEKGRSALFGVYLVHLSVLLILIGGIVGSLLGFEAFVTLPEGQATDRVVIRNSRTTLTLPFVVACDKFTIAFYDNGTPKEYRSDLKFYHGETLELEGSTSVNHPLTYRGIAFYQSTYGQIPGKSTLRLEREGSGANPVSVDAERGTAYPLPGGEGTFRVRDLHTNLRGSMGPAALISVEPDEGEVREFWVFQNPEELKKIFPENMLRSPRLDPASFKPYRFSLTDIESVFYTGLQVSRDPGVPLVWAGFILMMAGLFVTFFHSLRQVWIRTAREGDALCIEVAGLSGKNPVGMDRELDLLTGRLRQKLSGVAPDTGHSES